MESQFNSSDRERRALKAQNESLSSMNDRLRTEQEILHRQKSGSDLLTENLKLLQHQLEKAQSADRMRLDNEAAETKAEVALLRKKNEKDTAEFMGSMKAWEATQAELRAALEASKEAERDATDKVNQSTAAIEDLNQVNAQNILYPNKVDQASTSRNYYVIEKYFFLKSLLYLEV